MIAAIYIALGILLTIYTGGTLILMIIAFITRHRSPSLPLLTHTPAVTVQLPIYNERYVVERLLDATGKLDYPNLTIQLLDDSTDETSQIAARKVAQLREQGIDMQHIRRKERTGYKAGALTYGMQKSQTPFYAIFDADFLPPPDFLKRTMPYLLANPSLGMVQGRWGHLNPYENALTAAQSLAIDGHFVIEQAGRSRAGLLLNFNGTGGVWRADCIEQAGGWRDTTLTEDLDLSYRAQFKGWQLMTLPELVVHGELPPQLVAFKQQQFRWAKGSTQCLSLHMGNLWRIAGLSLSERLMGTLHLCQYMPYPILLLLAILAPPLMLTRDFASLPLGFLLFSGVVPPLMYALSQWMLHRDWYRRILAFPALIVFGTGIALSNTLAILAALIHDTGEFRRTPKFGADWVSSDYALPEDFTIYAELFMALYMGWGTWLAIHRAPEAAPYLALSALSYGLFALWGFYERWQIHYHHMHPAHE